MLLPYTEIDGIRTVKDSVIKGLFQMTVTEGLDKIVFYEGTVQTADEFLRVMKNSMSWLFMKDGEIIGYTWLNRFENKTARHHFCVFKDHWGQLEELGRYTIQRLVNLESGDGYVFDLLTGFIPAWNERAIKFALKCGGKTHGVIPNAIWNHEKQQSEDAVFIYYTRSEP